MVYNTHSVFDYVEEPVMDGDLTDSSKIFEKVAPTTTHSNLWRMSVGQNDSFTFLFGDFIPQIIYMQALPGISCTLSLFLII